MDRHLSRGFLGAIALGAALFGFNTNAAAQDDRREGALKICKVAGEGVDIGTKFTFTITPPSPFPTVTVPAGPPSADSATPGGYCVVAGIFPVGTHVVLVETDPPEYTVRDIDVVPPPPFSLSLPDKTVEVVIGPGVTEVTYTNEAGGVLEICKFVEDPKDYAGTFTFTVKLEPSGPTQTYEVRANTCLPATALPAGNYTITEGSPSPLDFWGCGAWRLGVAVGTCDSGLRQWMGTIAAGDVSKQTIVWFRNGKHGSTEALKYRKSKPGAKTSLPLPGMGN